MRGGERKKMDSMQRGMTIGSTIEQDGIVLIESACDLSSE